MDSVNANRLRNKLELRNVGNAEKVKRLQSGFRLLSAEMTEHLTDVGRKLCRKHSPRVWACAHTAKEFSELVSMPQIRRDALPVLEVGCVCTEIALHQEDLNQSFEIMIRFRVVPETEESSVITTAFSTKEIQQTLKALTSGDACGKSKEVSPSVYSVELWVRPRELMVVLQITKKTPPTISILLKEVLLFQEVY